MLGLSVLLLATGALAGAASAVVRTIGGAVAGLTGAGGPEPSGAAPTFPVIVEPGQPYTRDRAVDLVVTVPPAADADTERTVRIYRAVPDEAPARVDEVAVGARPAVVVPVELVEGRNDFTATVVGAAGESEPSTVASWVLDLTPPEISLTAPEDGATLNRTAATVTGTTQPGSEIVAHNGTNAASATATAGDDGAFEVAVPLKAGPNAITIGATDPAGNAAELALKVTRGDGKLTARVRIEPTRLRVSRLPDPVAMSVVVTDPDGRPLEGALVSFHLLVPGIRAISSSEVATGPDGRARFTTTVPPGATVGDVEASVLVRTDEFGETTDHTVGLIIE